LLRRSKIYLKIVRYDTPGEFFMRSGLYLAMNAADFFAQSCRIDQDARITSLQYFSPEIEGIESIEVQRFFNCLI
jgi:hypothetical protein